MRSTRSIRYGVAGLAAAGILGAGCGFTSPLFDGLTGTNGETDETPSTEVTVPSDEVTVPSDEVTIPDTDVTTPDVDVSVPDGATAPAGITFPSPDTPLSAFPSG